MTDTTMPVPYTPAYGQPAPPKSARLGAIALILALAVFVLSIVASVVNGIAAGQFADTSNGVMYTTNFESSDPAEVALSLSTMAHALIGTLAGITALILGIVATATAQGRRFGIPAMVLAFLAPGLSAIVFIVVMALSVPR